MDDGILVGIIAGVVFLFGIFLGSAFLPQGVDDLKKQAIINGCAEYAIEEGKPVWQWKENKE